MNLITGLDLGTSKIRVLIVKKGLREEGEVELVLKAEEESRGIRRGTVVGVEKVSEILLDFFSRISDNLDQKINSVYINLDGSHLFSLSSRGLVSVSRADRKISQEDINRVLEAAQTINLSLNKEVFDIFPKEFIIDEEERVKKPLGLKGVRLEVEALTLGAFSPYLENVKKAVLGANLSISDIVPSALAAAKAVLTEKQRELGVAVLDIGAGVSNLAVFEEGSLIHFAVLPMGSSNITSDIAIGLKTDIDVAERIKIEYGSCVFKGKDTKQEIDVGREEPLLFSQKFLVKVIASRVSEIFKEANKELKNISKEELLPAGVVLTGGGSKLPEIMGLAKKEFRLPARLGQPQGISGLEEDLSLATVCGLALHGIELEEEEGGFRLTKDLGSKIKKIFRMFIP